MMSWLWRWAAPLATVGGLAWKLHQQGEEIARLKRALCAAHERERELQAELERRE